MEGAPEPDEEPLVDLEAAQRLAKLAQWTDPDIFDEDADVAWIREVLRFRAGWEVAEERKRRDDS